MHLNNITIFKCDSYRIWCRWYLVPNTKTFSIFWRNKNTDLQNQSNKQYIYCYCIGLIAIKKTFDATFFPLRYTNMLRNFVAHCIIAKYSFRVEIVLWMIVNDLNKAKNPNESYFWSPRVITSLWNNWKL